jgi:hypothetical protein
MDNFEKLCKMLERQSSESERALNSMAKIIEAVEQTRHQWEGMSKGIEHAQNQWRNVEQAFAMSVERTKQRFEDTFLTYERSIKNIERISREWAKWTELTLSIEKMQPLHSPRMTEIYLAKASWQSSIASIAESFRQSRLLDSHPLFSNRLLEPYNRYSEFARETFEKFREDMNPDERGALDSSLILAEKQVVSAAGLLRESVVRPVDSDAPVASPIIDIFDIQQKELLNARNIPQVDQDYLVLLKLSPTAALSQKARKVTERVILCNRNAKLLGDEEIFTPTTSFLEAQNNLGWIRVEDNFSLGNLVDCLYIMLYEAAGAGTLRYEKFMNDEACSIIWAIKHLRNKLLRHDPDHGNEPDQRKSWWGLSNSLSKLGASSLPRTREDFQGLHRRLLDEVDVFLQKLTMATEKRLKE